MNANERYAAEVEQPPRAIMLGLTAVAFVCALLSQNVWTYGRRRATITDRETGDVVGRFAERPIVGERSSFGLMLTDLETRPASEFEQMWLASNDNVLSRKPRWNTEASFPSGPGSDAGVGFVYDVINWFVKKWRAMRERRATYCR